MAFVTCSQFKNAQEEQANAAMKAEKALLDCAENAVGVTTSSDCSDNGKGGVITIAKIKQAIADDVAVAVKPNSGLTGNGTKASPLEIKTGNGLTIDTNGYVALDSNATTKAVANKNFLDALKANGLLGDGLDVVNGKLIVKTDEIMDASGTVHQFFAVKK
ncbi:hypothetical protein [Lonepinella sp. BR2474]|uniref:hypothetical protein n=1 Tax=Lonepinella sp. BR2474 TaxID=3434548 RepID=UPI003F6DD424